MIRERNHQHERDESESRLAPESNARNRMQFSNETEARAQLLERARDPEQDIVSIDTDDDFDFATDLRSQFRDLLD